MELDPANLLGPPLAKGEKGGFPKVFRPSRGKEARGIHEIDTKIDSRQVVGTTKQTAATDAAEEVRECGRREPGAERHRDGSGVQQREQQHRVRGAGRKKQADAFAGQDAAGAQPLRHGGGEQVEFAESNREGRLGCRWIHEKQRCCGKPP
jgi:hypothetical protein